MDETNGQRRVVVAGDVDDDAAEDLAAAVAHAPLGVEHQTLLGAKGRDLAEHFPLAAGALPSRLRGRDGQVLGQVEGEATDQRVPGTEELDVGDDARPGQARLAPHEERHLAVRRRFAVDQPRESGEPRRCPAARARVPSARVADVEPWQARTRWR